MKYMTSSEIRRTWLNFFASKGHMIEPGASLVPHNDPTLLWINAGVAALKKYFDGSERPNSNRITNAQKAIRTNDIDNVGRTARHHTFFEMLGNFSIGDYFRNEVIPWAYELLTSKEYFGFDKDRLYMTVHPLDQDSINLWIKCGVDPSHLIPLEGNFWEIGEGPCGPDTEIFFDRGEKYDPEGLGLRLLKEDMDNDRYIEIWNIVFSQYNAKEGVERSKYQELPQKNIDTGAGLERLTCIIQDGETNFDTDLFLPIIREVEKISKHSYAESEYKMAYRVIADHIRTTTFALADGALFSNEGRGYVLRRILRRAVRYGKKLQIEGLFMYNLVPVVAEIMKDYYPYLEEKIPYISKLIRIEEEKFQQTLKDGEELLRDEIDKLDGNVISGEIAFKLYDTCGFPIELTQEIALESNKEVDVVRFKELLLEQKERARKSREKVNSMNKQSKDLLEFKDEVEFSYETGVINSKVVALFKDGERVKELEGYGEVVFAKTNFYAEMGGEVADSGYFLVNNEKVEVIDVHKSINKQHLHSVELAEGISIREGDEVELHLDDLRRERIAAAHSATHLLQQALKDVLGSHISQAGSYVNDGFARFDFNHYEKISLEDLRKIERLVNEKISNGLKADIKELPIAEAKKLNATAIFDEKYGDVVRVVNLGNYSIEFCGGCHVTNTRNIGLFVIDKEESISSGVRRIEAYVGLKAYEYFDKKRSNSEETMKLLNAKSDIEINSRLQTLKTQFEDSKKQLQELKNQIALLEVNKLISNAKKVNDALVMINRFEALDSALLMNIVNELKSKNQEFFFFGFNVNKDKVNLICAISKGLVAKGNHAGNLIKKVAIMLGGNGGGKPDVAQAGGKNVELVDEALKLVESEVIL